MSERKRGWYWVRLNGTWTCQWYDGGNWPLVVSLLTDIEIGQRLPSPDERNREIPEPPSPPPRSPTGYSKIPRDPQRSQRFK